MNTFHLSIRNLATVALCLFGSMSVAFADASVSGKVIGLNQNAHSFTVQYSATFHSHHGMASHDVSHERTFKTTDKTVYTLGGAKASWADLKKGVHVNVTAHAGVADNVQIVPAS